MTEENKRTFLEHARKEVPREACGLLILENGIETLVICKNISYGNQQFEIDQVEYSLAEDRGEVIAVVHSHPNGSPKPSPADMLSCSELGVKWYIVGTIEGRWEELQPSGYKAPLIGRQWCHGLLDCYSIIRDYYKEILNIEVPDFPRQFNWWNNGQNLYADNFEKAGFLNVKFDDINKSIKKHDVVLMMIGKTKVINHGGVYLGDGQFLHHVFNRLSARNPFGGYWARHTVKIVRHKDLFNDEDKALRSIG